MQHRLRIGTRGSPLALAQARAVRDALLAAHGQLAPERLEIVPVRTQGDRVLDRPLAEIGGKGLFTAEIEERLLSGDLDCAVHSTKDMPTVLPDGLMLAAFLEREDPRDAWISAAGNGPGEIASGAVVGTASLRRRAQILAMRPDLDVVPLRGNVETRLAKIARGEADATLLALAGLRRLGLESRAFAVLSPEEMLPAPAQGAICIETRSGDGEMRRLLAPLDHPPTACAVTAERAFLAALEGSCRTPIAALAEVAGTGLRLRGRLLAPDGSACFSADREGSVDDAVAIGDAAGAALRREAGEPFFRSLLAAG